MYIYILKWYPIWFHLFHSGHRHGFALSVTMCTVQYDYSHGTIGSSNKHKNDKTTAFA